MSATIHHIPVCPFSQRVEILLDLKGRRSDVDFAVVDITKPRDPRLLALTGGSTALPVLELPGGRSLKESLVLLEYIEAAFPDPPVRRADPYQRALESLLVSMEGFFVASGYRLVMNQDPTRRQALVDDYLDQHARIDAFLVQHGQGDGPWLFDDFGHAEVVFAPFFRRFAFVDWYEGVDLPDGDHPDADRFTRVRAWRAACLAHPAAQQVTDEEIIKLYYDYSRGAGNGALVEGRSRSSFVFDPDWRDRPMPPRGKPVVGATDAELGLV